MSTPMYSVVTFYITVPTVLDVTIGFPADQPEPTMMDAIGGKHIQCSMIAK